MAVSKPIPIATKPLDADPANASRSPELERTDSGTGKIGGKWACKLSHLIQRTFRNTAMHLVSSLLVSRPVIVYGPPAFRRYIEGFVRALSLLKPVGGVVMADSGSLNRQGVCEWRKFNDGPLRISEVAQYRLMGLSNEVLIPQHLGSLITLIDLAEGKLRSPLYMQRRNSAAVISPTSNQGASGDKWMLSGLWDRRRSMRVSDRCVL